MPKSDGGGSQEAPTSILLKLYDFLTPPYLASAEFDPSVTLPSLLSSTLKRNLFLCNLMSVCNNHIYMFRQML